jgi:hypothetical protein
MDERTETIDPPSGSGLECRIDRPLHAEAETRFISQQYFHSLYLSFTLMAS